MVSVGVGAGTEQGSCSLSLSSLQQGLAFTFHLSPYTGSNFSLLFEKALLESPWDSLP